MKGNRAIFTVPAIELINQTLTEFWNEGIHDIAAMQADHEWTDPTKSLQICSIQTLLRRDIPPAAIVMVDECHRQFKFLNEWMADPEWASTPFVGLSATPWAKGMGKQWDDLLIPTTTAELIEQGYLSKFRVFGPAAPDLSGVKTVTNLATGEKDYHEGQLAAAMDKPDLVADVVETWLRLGERRPTLCFAVNRAHAKNIQEKFLQAGVRAGYLDAYSKSEEREATKAQFKSGELEVVCNVGVLTTGVDWDVRCIILARPTKSEILFVQIIGRGLRTAEGKDHCLIIDHTNTHSGPNGLGFVTDIHHDELDDGKPKGERRERKPPLPKPCPQCTYLIPPKTLTCPCCGFVRKPQAGLMVDEDGELVELVSRNVAKPPGAKADKATKQEVYSQLLFLAGQKGYSSGWAAHKYRAYFGVWPRSLVETKMPPGPEVLAFVRKETEAWKKNRGVYGNAA